MRAKVFFKNGYTKRFRIKETIDVGENDYKGFIVIDNGRIQISKKEIDYIKVK